MKNNFLHLSNAKATRNTGGGNSHQFKQFWQYAACLLLAFVLGIGNVWGTYTYNASTSVPEWTVNFNSWAGESDASGATDGTVHNPRLYWNGSAYKNNLGEAKDIAFDAGGFYYIYAPNEARQLPTGSALSALCYVVAKAQGSYFKYNNTSSTVSDPVTTLNGLTTNNSQTTDVSYEFHMPRAGYVRMLIGTDANGDPTGTTNDSWKNVTLSGATEGTVAVTYHASGSTYVVKTKTGATTFSTTTYTSAGKKMRSVEFALNSGTTTMTTNPAKLSNNSGTARKMFIYAVEVYLEAETSCAATAEAGENKATTVGEGVAMAATAASSGYTGAWSIKSGSPSTATSQLGTTSSNTMTFTPATYGTYTLVWTVTDDSDGSCSATDEATVTVPAPTHGVTASVNNALYGSAAAAATTVGEGATTTITATPNSGYQFVSWALSGTGAASATLSSTTTNPTTLTMGTGDVTVTATFEEKTCPTSGNVFSMTVTSSSTVRPPRASDSSNPGWIDLADYATISGYGEAKAGNLATGSDKGGITSTAVNLDGNDGVFWVALDCPLQVGDVITATVSGNTVYLTPDCSRASGITLATGTDVTYTIVKDDKLDGESNIYGWKGGGNAKISAFSINRPAKYALTWNFAGGATSSTTYTEAGSYLAGTAITYPADNTMSKDDYEFTGWSSSATEMPAEPLTITAQWQEVCHATAPGDISAGDLTDGEITLTAEGSAETGDTWYWQSASDGTSTSDEYDAENGKTVDEAGTYYLRSYNTSGDCWSDATSITLEDDDFVPHYAITYNKGEYGSGDAIAAGDKTKDVDFTLSSDRYTRAGYLQVGWATSDGGSKAYDLGGTYSDNAALILYPVWAETSTYVASFACANTAPTGWTFSNDGYGDSKGTADYVCKFVANEITTPKQTSTGDKTGDDDVAFAKSTDAIATYDLGAACIVTALNVTLCGGSSSAFDEEIEYLGADGTTVKKSYTNSLSAGNWKDNVINKNEVVEGVKFIRIHGASKWVVMKAFSVTYVDLTPKYTVTYVPNNGVVPAETMTDSDSPYKAGTEVTLLTNTFTAPATKEFDAWVVTPAAGGDPITITNGKFTMPSTNVNVTATWKTPAPKYGVTYVLNGPTGDAPTEASKAEGAEFTLAAAPSWDGHVFQGWKWTDATPEDHVVAAEAAFTMPAYAVTFTAQWKLENDAAFSNKVAFENAEVALGSLFTSSSDGTVTYALKVASENASIAGTTFTATAAGEYVVVATQATTSTYVAAEKEATIEVLETEVEDIFIFNKKADYGGEGKCLTADQANTDDGVHQYTAIAYEGFTGMGRAEADNTECILTFSVKPAYSSALGIKSICTYGKFEEPLGGQISWDGGTSWEDLAAYTDGKEEFDAPGTFPTSFKIKFMGVSKKSGGLWWRNALVTLEKKKAITNTAIDLTAVKINNVAISAANLTILKTADAYALDIEDEYVTAPTVKFNKHTVITYEDDSELEKDDVITETAAVNLSGKWEASAEIDDITYTVTMAKADAFVVHYYESDGETLIGSENVALSGHPTAAGITPTPIDYKRVVWTRSGVAVDLDDVTSAVAGTEITLVASYVDAYASSINIEQWVLDNRKNNTAFRAVLDAQGFKYSNLDDLDSLTVAKNETDRNYPFLGQKWKLAASEISFLLKNGSTVKARFGNMGSSVNVKIGSADAVELTSGSYANSSPSSSKEYSYTATADVVVKFQGTGTGTVVIKQIMIDEDIASMTLPAIVTYDANGGSFAKTSEKYTGTPLVIADATPASEDYLFDGWHLGTVDGATIDATGYEPTKNVTLVAKYVLKPSPFSLSALTYKIGDGAATAVGYEEGTYEYTVKLPYAHSYDAITVAATLSDGTSSLKAAISQPVTVPGDASFTVVADDESEQEYVVHLVKDAKDGLEIIGAVVTGNTTATVTGVYKGDASVNLNSKKIDNGDYYIYVTLKDGYTFEETDVLVVDVHTKSDIGTKALEITIGVGDISGDVWKTIALDDYSTGENIIALTGIAANQTSIGLKRSANINAKINGLKVLRPMNPVLKSITVAGVEGAPVADVVTIEVPFSTSDEALSSVAIDWISNSDAWTDAHDPAVANAWAWGVENTVTLTDKDGDQSVYSVTISKAVASTDATLSALSYGDPATAIALQDGVYEYNVILPYGTTVVPALAATKNHVGAAEPVIADASVFANRHAESTVTITAEDNSTVLVYTVNFEVSRYQEIMLWDGSTMSAVVANGNASLKGVTWEATGVSPTSFSAKTCAENSKSYTKALDFGGTTGNSRQFSITIPNGYLAKLSLVYRAKDTDERYLMISSALAGAVNENTIGSVKAQGNSSDLFVVTFDQLVAGKVYINTTQGFHVHEIRILMTPAYARSVTSGTYGTVCVDHNVAIEDIQGVTVYELMGREPVYRKLAFDEIVSGELEAGAPYVFQANGDRMIMLYGETKVDEPVDKHNGMYGTFEQVVLTELDDVYYFAQKALWSCDGALDLTIPANRAYVKLSEIGDLSDPNPASGRRRVTMNVNGEKIATGIDALNASEAPVKMMINGQLFILHGEKMFDATGRLVK